MAGTPPIVLHVGAPKAGSSALQHDLTWNPRRALDGRWGKACEYVVIDAVGGIWRRDALADFAALYAAHYANSADLTHLVALPAERLSAINAALGKLRAEGTVPILSYEMWLIADEAAVHRFTAALAAPLHVVAYVRDPVSWMQSLSWQSRDFGGKSTAAWVETYLGWAQWSELLARWATAPNVQRVDVRLLEGGVCGDFAALIGSPPPSEEIRHNSGLPGEFVRFIRRGSVHPDLHLSEAKFAWARWVHAAGAGGELDPAPLMFTAAEIAMIIDGTLESSRKLLSLCTADIRERLQADARWWSAEPAIHATRRTPRTPALTLLEESDQLLGETLRAMVAADGGWRAAESRLRHAEARCRKLETEVSGLRQECTRARRWWPSRLWRKAS